MLITKDSEEVTVFSVGSVQMMGKMDGDGGVTNVLLAICH